MAISVGFTGLISVAGTALGNNVKGNLNYKRKLVDTTSINTTGPETVAPTTYGVTGTIELTYDSADTAQTALITALTSGTSAALVLKTAASGANTVWTIGTAYLEDVKFDVAPHEMVKMAATWKSSGAVTFA